MVVPRIFFTTKAIRPYLLLFLASVVIWEACSRKSSSALPDQISYNFHVRPILADKCFTCHGPDKSKIQAGLRLDLPETALAPLRETKGAFAIVPGKPAESELIRRVTSKDPEIQMPTPDSHLGTLSELEVEILEKWIEQGAQYEPHWAFTRPAKTALPSISDAQWPRNEIDYFTRAKMDEKGLAPNAPAGNDYLLKRVAMDLTGLPPSPALMDQFAAANSDADYEKVVDQLLQSPQYGEKMAIMWLDIARYADSYGYQDDNLRSQWPYRDWVIHAFNQNIPYDQFVTWQLAGDLLPQANKEQILATAFLRNHKYTEEGGVIPEEYRVEYLVDKVKTFSKGMLALTVECAQCHDHKYDPIAQKDYYQLYAFFNNSKELGFEGDVSISKPAKQPVITLSDEEVKNVLNFINKKDTGAVMVSVMGERDTFRPTHILDRGRYDKPSEVVQAAAPKSIMPFDTSRFQRNRLGLAQWTVSRDNPLTARVFVNFIWQEFFGTGIVKTAGDFGLQGNLPTHPELLDWLAVDLMEHNWDVKRLVKQIVLSATYRQSGQVTEDHLQKDPENTWLARAPRLRLKAEFVRDMLMATSELLNTDIGGPSVKPYQPKGLWEVASPGRGLLSTYKQDKGRDLYRRGMYTFIKLTLPPPTMMVFDASNRDQCEVKRPRTNTPLQALIMMNDPTVLEAARVFAQRLMKAPDTPENRIKKAFRSIICRNASDKENAILNSYYSGELQDLQAHPGNASKTLNVGEYPQESSVSPVETAALMKTIATIYNMEEAITR